MCSDDFLKSTSVVGREKESAEYYQGGSKLKYSSSAAFSLAAELQQVLINVLLQHVSLFL
jgi:hypothetical protein